MRTIPGSLWDAEIFCVRASYVPCEMPMRFRETLGFRTIKVHEV